MGVPPLFSSDYSGMIRGSSPNDPEGKPHHLKLITRNGELVLQISRRDGVPPVDLRFTMKQTIDLANALQAALSHLEVDDRR